MQRRLSGRNTELRASDTDPCQQHGSRHRLEAWQAGRCASDEFAVAAVAQAAAAVPVATPAGLSELLKVGYYKLRCWMQAWSAFREPSFGHGMLTLNDATTAQWRWTRNQDAGDAVVGDAVWSDPNLTRKPPVMLNPTLTLLIARYQNTSAQLAITPDLAYNPVFRSATSIRKICFLCRFRPCADLKPCSQPGQVAMSPSQAPSSANQAKILHMPAGSWLSSISPLACS